MPQGAMPYQDGTWPDYADFIDDDGEGRVPDDIDGLGNDLPTWMAAVGDGFETIPEVVGNEVTQQINDHVLGTSNPHPATAITVTAAGNVTADNVQAALEQLDANSSGAAALTNHINDPIGAHDASAISINSENFPDTDVATALDTLFTDKSDTTHSHTLDGLSDVNTSGAIANSVIKYNGSTWVVGVDNDSGSGTGATQLDELTDVDLTGQVDGDALTRVAGVWTPVPTATQAELDAHTADTSAAHAASAISFSATGGIAATDVQAAVAEVDTEAAKKAANLSDLADAATARTSLGLGTMSTQAASAVAITGGTVAGIADLAVADGGTGASTAAAARTNLDAAQTSHSHSLDSLSDVDTSGAAATNVLAYNGSAWAPAAASSGSGGGRTIRTVTASGAVTALTSDDVLVIDPNGADRTVNLPSLASSITANLVLTVVKNTANPNFMLTLDGNGSDAILDDAVLRLTGPYESITVIPTTARWLVI